MGETEGHRTFNWSSMIVIALLVGAIGFGLGCWVDMDMAEFVAADNGTALVRDWHHWRPARRSPPEIRDRWFGQGRREFWTDGAGRWLQIWSEEVPYGASERDQGEQIGDAPPPPSIGSSGVGKIGAAGPNDSQ